MEENHVLVWFGKFNSEEELENYVEEEYNDDGDVSSEFINDFALDFIDNQFQEVVFEVNGINKENLKDVSFSDSFLSLIEDFKDYNSAIFLFGSDYEITKKESSRMKFIGKFNFEFDF